MRLKWSGWRWQEKGRRRQRRDRLARARGLAGTGHYISAHNDGFIKNDVADRLQRDCIGIELSAAYAALAERRIAEDAGPLIADVQTDHAQMEMFT